MTLYALQKAIYVINREEAEMARYKADPGGFASGYEMTVEEAEAFSAPNVGLLYVLGVNGQLLMHFAASCGYEWNAYIAAMKDGLRVYGPVREGIYAAKGDLS